jgi:hypothetical protein
MIINGNSTMDEDIFNLSNLAMLLQVSSYYKINLDIIILRQTVLLIKPKLKLSLMRLKIKLIP